MDAFWQEKHYNPVNDKGNIFDEISEMLHPRTLSDEGIKQFVSAMMQQAHVSMD